VLDALKEYKGHPSAEEVYLAVKKNNPKVALGTVYQALSILEELGLIEAKRWSESPIRYDLNTDPHYDIRCTRCGEVAEIPGIEYEDFATRIRKNTSYKVTNTALVIARQQADAFIGLGYLPVPAKRFLRIGGALYHKP
jgi:Fe2+ or Zn2+ uptake regulation protein